MITGTEKLSKWMVEARFSVLRREVIDKKGKARMFHVVMGYNWEIFIQILAYLNTDSDGCI
jgi:hypothetical protein